MIRRPLAIAAGALAVATPSIAQPDTSPGLVEVFPHVRADRDAGIVEFDAFVPMTIDDPEQVVFLEVIVCTRNSKEHEALLATDARPSNIHAALLLLGVEPGEPGSWEVTEDGAVTLVPPKGPEIEVEFVWTDAEGVECVDHPASWVVNDNTGEGLPERDWLFAGSRFVDWTPPGREAPVEVYDADYSGTLIGLATFGTETLAWPAVISHESSVETPVWIVSAERAPPLETPVVVRLKPARE